MNHEEQRTEPPIYGAGDSYGGNASHDDAPAREEPAGVNSRAVRLRLPQQKPGNTSSSRTTAIGRFRADLRDRRHFQALAEHNRKKFPDENRLKAGEEIVTPALAELERATRNFAPSPSIATRPNARCRSSAARCGTAAAGCMSSRKATPCSTLPATNWQRPVAEIYERTEAIGTDFDHQPGNASCHATVAAVTQRSEDRFHRMVLKIVPADGRRSAPDAAIELLPQAAGVREDGAEDGTIPGYRLHQTDSPAIACTEQNVLDSDGTLIPMPGGRDRATRRLAHQHGKPCSW